MKKSAYCPICEKDTILKIRNEHRTVYIDGVNVDYTADFGYCSICNEELFDEELSEKEVAIANKRYRELTDIITTEDVETILETYDMSGHNLSLLLGWSDRTVDRYKSGKMPAPEYSKRLKALSSPINMYIAFEQGKQRISETLGQKLLGVIHRLLGAGDTQSPNIYSVAGYFIKRASEEDESDLSPLKLQKLVYYAHAWHLGRFEKTLTSAGFEAWKYGPVNREMYETFKIHHSEALSLPSDFKPFQFDLDSKAILDLVWNTYGLFAARSLVNISHKEDPWLKARNGLPDSASCEAVIDSNEIIDFHHKLIEEMNSFDEKSLMKYIEAKVKS